MAISNLAGNSDGQEDDDDHPISTALIITTEDRFQMLKNIVDVHLRP
jgi:hypothetical protein